ncbi:MAG TPA: RnfH family protein [Candidatus Acidoferrum sp.]|nr:RnfH family protein [Candidatus Acidoferrum sp.]
MSGSGEELINVEVAYALPQRQLIKSLQVKPGCTALQAAQLSGIAEAFPGLDLATADMGIFSHNLDGKTLPLPADYQVKAGDRIEIYRPLVADPKLARQQRVAKARAEKKQ